MNFKFNKNKLIFSFINIILIIIYAIISNNYITYHSISVISTIFVFLTVLLNVLFEKKIISSNCIILYSFILFQFGLPILNAFNESYTNWYLTQLNSIDLIECVKISTVCIQFFSLAFIISFDDNSKNNYIKVKYLNDNNSNIIYYIAKKIFAFSAIFAFPLSIYVGYLAIKNGYSYVKNDSMSLYNGFTNFVQEMIVPSMILMYIFSPSEQSRKKIFAVALLYSFIWLLIGSRTNSICLAAILLFMNYEFSYKKNTKTKKSKNPLKLILSFSLIILIGVLMAQIRYNGTISSTSVFDFIYSTIEEMGFNFTSIAFTKLYVPIHTNYQYGLSYIYSFICLIPKSLDFSGTIVNLHNILPETWLNNNLHLSYGKLYDFGVGYSVIAESYYNFGKLAFISIFIQGLIIGKFLSKNTQKSSKFQLYIKYIILYSLITYPRRTFLTLLKCFEYRILLIIILIFFITKMLEKKKGKI